MKKDMSITGTVTGFKKRSSSFLTPKKVKKGPDLFFLIPVFFIVDLFFRSNSRRQTFKRRKGSLTYDSIEPCARFQLTGFKKIEKRSIKVGRIVETVQQHDKAMQEIVNGMHIVLV